MSDGVKSHATTGGRLAYTVYSGVRFAVTVAGAR